MTDWIEDLERLSALHSAGHLSDQEFDAAKARVTQEHGIDGQSQGNHLQDRYQPNVPEQLDECLLSTVEYESYGPEDGIDPPKLWPKALVVFGLLCVTAIALWWLFSDLAVQHRTALVEMQDVNCRVSYGTGSAVHEIIPKGTTVELDKYKDGWAHVVGKYCWVKEDRLATVSQAGASTSPEDRAPSSNAVGAGSGPEFVSGPVGRISNAEISRLNELCPSISREIRYPANTPTYYSDFRGVSSHGLPIDVSYIVEHNGAHWSNPRVSAGKCVIDLETNGIINGNSYSWAATCEVQELGITDDHAVAFTQFDPRSCS